MLKTTANPSNNVMQQVYLLIKSEFERRRQSDESILMNEPQLISFLDPHFKKSYNAEMVAKLLVNGFGAGRRMYKFRRRDFCPVKVNRSEAEAV